jgi:mono/diheme cytochrome c family protein
MNKSFWIAAALIFAVAAANAQAPAGNAATGKDLFMQYNCYACHGFSGQNGSGARLVPPRLTQVAFTAYVRNPRTMPSYSAKVLSDAQLGDIFAYVKSLPDMSKPAKDIPLLTQIINDEGKK